MRYASAAAFRQAIENGLAKRTGGNNRAIGRSRKLIVIDRILARLLTIGPERWILKGGAALDLRLGDRARLTQDLDLGCQGTQDMAFHDLLALNATIIDDYFTFQIRREATLLPNEVAVRHHIQARLAGRPFEAMTIDVAPTVDSSNLPDLLPGIDLLEFSGIPRLNIPTISIEQHLAEKLHAYTQVYAGGRQSTRVKDLVDMVLIQANLPVNAHKLRDAIAATFADRDAQDMPSSLPPPTGWTIPYRAMARDVGIDADVTAGYAAAGRLLDPVLDGSVISSLWDPALHRWGDVIES